MTSALPDTIAAAIDGDVGAFATLTERYRHELQVHCYRMLASFEDAEDAAQETFLRAWRSRETFDGSRLFRAWLYRIATNVCLDAIRQSSQRGRTVSADEIAWLTPYPDQLLDACAPSDQQPDAIVVERETIELAFLVALQVLPPRQRATLIMRDILGWPAAAAAEHLQTSVAAANSALQRARATLQVNLPARRAEWLAGRQISVEERAVLDQFMAAHERCDAEAAIAMAATDIRVTMPPYPWLYNGIGELESLVERAFGANRDGDWRLLATAVNRMPSSASYLRRHGDSVFRPYKLDVLCIVASKIAEITTFGPEWFARLGLPDELS